MRPGTVLSASVLSGRFAAPFREDRALPFPAGLARLKCANCGHRRRSAKPDTGKIGWERPFLVGLAPWKGPETGQRNQLFEADMTAVGSLRTIPRIASGG